MYSLGRVAGQGELYRPTATVGICGREFHSPGTGSAALNRARTITAPPEPHVRLARRAIDDDVVEHQRTDSRAACSGERAPHPYEVLITIPAMQ